MNSLRLEIGEQPRFSAGVQAVTNFITDLSDLFSRLAARNWCCLKRFFVLAPMSGARSARMMRLSSRCWRRSSPRHGSLLRFCPVSFDAACFFTGGRFALQARGAGRCAQGSAQVILACLLVISTSVLHSSFSQGLRLAS